MEKLFTSGLGTDIPHTEGFLFGIILKKPENRIRYGKIVNHIPSLFV
jgi:hypothetical protein